jgi:vancomycin permeability regulator SanA
MKPQINRRRFMANRPFQAALPRGLALWFGGFGLLNVVGDLLAPGFNENLWWLDLRNVPALPEKLVLFACSLVLIAFGVRPVGSRWRRVLTLACASTLAGIATFNSVQFYYLLWQGRIRAGVPLPLSLLVATAMALIIRPLAKAPPSPCREGRLLLVVPICLAWLLAFPVLQMVFFGKTDYRRPAEVTVVLGARVYADGRPSDALADRVRTACQLYRDGLTRKLIVSGGPGNGPVGEAEAMKRMAVQLGVGPQDILVDNAGVNTQATVKNTEELLAGLHASRVLVVSHFYHLPRVKLAYQRAGREVYTVPARENFLFLHPYNMCREIAALWVYYLRPPASRS